MAENKARVKRKFRAGVFPTDTDYEALVDRTPWTVFATQAALLGVSGTYAADANNPGVDEFTAGDLLRSEDGHEYRVLASDASPYDATMAGSVVRLEHLATSPALIEARVTTLEGAGVGSGLWFTPAAKTSTAINAAIDLAAAAPGGVVYCEAGTYDITSTIILKDRVALVGDGPGKTIFELANGANCDVIRSVDAYHEFFEIRGIWIEGNRPNQGADNGTDTTNYRGIRILGNSSPGTQASNSQFNLTDPRGIIRDVFIYNIKGDALFLEQSRELDVSNVNTAFCGRRSIYSRTVDSNFSNCVFGPCDIGAPVLHGASNRFSNIKFWGNGNGNDNLGEITALWDNIAAALDANDGSAGYDYPNAFSIAADDLKGCGVIIKEPKTTISGLMIQDTSGTGVWYAGGDSIISGLVIDRAGEVADQFNIASVIEPPTKYGLRLNSGDLIAEAMIYGTTGRSSRPDYGFYAGGSGDYDVTMLGEDDAYTVGLSSIVNTNGVFNGNDVADLDTRLTAAESDIDDLEAATGTFTASTVPWRNTSYDPAMISLDFENEVYSSEAGDPRSGNVGDYISCTRSGSTWAIQQDGAIQQFAANTPTMGKLGDVYGMIHTNGERNWVLNSFSPSEWTDTNTITSVPEFYIPGHQFRKISQSSYYQLIPSIDSGASWSSSAIVPVRMFFVHGEKERIRIRLRDTSDNDDAQITVTGTSISKDTETLGTISGEVLYRHGPVMELQFYVTLAAALTAANLQVGISTGIDDTSYTTYISGVEIGDAGDQFTSIIKTTTADAQAQRSVTTLNPNLFVLPDEDQYCSFELRQNVTTQFVTLEITDTTDTTEWRINSDGRSQRVANSGGAVTLLTNTPTLAQGRTLVRGYWGDRYGVSLDGEPIYSAPATGNFIFRPTTVYIGGSSSGTTGVVRSFKLTRGRVDPQPLRVTDGCEWYDPEVTIAGVEQIIRPQMVQGEEYRSAQLLGRHPMEHVRIAAENGDYAASGDDGIKFRNEWNLNETIAAGSTFHSFEFIIAVEPHVEITGTFPFYVLLQLKDDPDGGETGSSPPLALEVTGADTYRLISRTSTAEDVGAGATPSFVTEHSWSFTPFEAHHIILDWKDGRGEANGLIRMWLNGTKVVDEVKFTGYNNDNECYPKWGVYAGPESGTSGEYAAHFMNFRLRRDDVSWSTAPNYTLPDSARQFGITLADQAW